MWMILRRHSANVSKSLQRELYLAFQVFALLCAFFVMFLYYLLQNYFSQTQNSGPVYTMRALYPIANGILSYINPFCILLLNRDFCRQFMRTLKCKRIRVCIADIISMIVFTTIWGIRMLPGLKEFYFNFQEYYIAAGTYNSIYFFLYIRCAGIVFLSIHRYLVISLPHHRVTMRIQEAVTWQLVVVYWTVPTLISIVVLKDTDFHYDALETMEVVAPRPVITV
ncbi:hypothetical protein CAEBREN_26278 [Caenorhabditis brenneri]|uniref:Uncharacterized protein n=1 Tax=Caenorhabditis brenneri TaxID=135651 RepID=G0NW38_CAEBE|nr:hypothetical protein CAEBREN_26278 [Caenorhabditis brenneri]